MADLTPLERGIVAAAYRAELLPAGAAGVAAQHLVEEIRAMDRLRDWSAGLPHERFVDRDDVIVLPGGAYLAHARAARDAAEGVIPSVEPQPDAPAPLEPAALPAPAELEQPGPEFIVLPEEDVGE